RGAALLAAGVAAVLAWRSPPVFRPYLGRPLPLALALLLVGIGLARLRGGPEAARRHALPLGITRFALALLGKMLVNARLYHYGFALAMPATLVVVVALASWVPTALDRLGGDGGVFRVGVLALLPVLVFTQLQVMHDWLARKTHPVGAGADSFFADERGPVVDRALAAIAGRTPPGATLTTRPDGVVLDHLARRVDPASYLKAVPPMVVVYGEAQVVAALVRRPPDYVALVHKDSSEHGVRFFGRDYGQRLAAWIHRNYRPLVRVGARPLRDERFGILLLRRRAALNVGGTAR